MRACLTFSWRASQRGCRQVARCPSRSCARWRRLRCGLRARRRLAASAAALLAAGPPPAASAPPHAQHTTCTRGLRAGGRRAGGSRGHALLLEVKALLFLVSLLRLRGLSRETGGATWARMQQRCSPARPARAPPPASRRQISRLRTRASQPCERVAEEVSQAPLRTRKRGATYAASCVGSATPRAFASAALSSKNPAGKAPPTLARFAGCSSSRAAAGRSLAGAGGAGIGRGGGAGAAAAGAATGSRGAGAGSDAGAALGAASGALAARAARSSATLGAGLAPLSRASALARNSACSFALSAIFVAAQRTGANGLRFQPR
jgi:hypothetical protein